MGNRQLRESPTRNLNSTSSSEVQLYVNGEPFVLNRELLAAKSVQLALLFREEDHPANDLSHVLGDYPVDADIFELVARFCHGFEIQLSIENVMHVACLAHHLGMTETHCRNNLLRKALEFFQHQIVPSWYNAIRALNAAENILQEAVDIGLVGSCVETIIKKALEHPNLLGEPVKVYASKDDDDREEKGDILRNNVRRKLFALDWKSEDLSHLSLRLYEPIITSMIQREVPSEYISASVFQYAKRWVFSGTKQREEECPMYKRNVQRGIIEAVERMLPNARGLLPCASLSEMLKSAIALEASEECKKGFEMRIGKQLLEAKPEDLLIPCQGYAKEEKYDTECIRRMLKNFYNNYNGGDNDDDRELFTVSELVDSFLIEIASDIDLKMGTFMSFVELSNAASEGIPKNSDGIYRAIDIYLGKHGYLSESEKEAICQLLDCNKLSAEACFHAARNERLPVRVVVQVMFVAHLQLRETAIPRGVKGFEESTSVNCEDEEATRASSGGREEEETMMRAEMVEMENKVVEMERECQMLRREIEKGNCRREEEKKKKGKVNIWKEMKRKFGCMTNSHHDPNCQVKKKKRGEPRLFAR